MTVKDRDLCCFKKLLKDPNFNHQKVISVDTYIGACFTLQSEHRFSVLTVLWTFVLFLKNKFITYIWEFDVFTWFLCEIEVAQLDPAN